MLFIFSLFNTHAANAPIATLGKVYNNASVVVVPITAKDINNIIAANLKFLYDPTILEVVSVTQGAGIGGIINTDMNLPGVLYIGWARASGITRPDNTIMFYVTFNRINNGTSLLTWDDDNGVSCEWSDGNFVDLNDSPTSTYYINGLVSNLSPVTIAPNLEACQDSVIGVPITVREFNNVSSLSLTLYFNPSVLEYVDFENDSDFPALDVFNNVAGKIVVVGMAPPPPGGTSGIYLSDDDVLFTLTFNYLGGISSLSWFDDGGSCEYSDWPGSTKFYDIPQSTYYIDGSVSLDVTPTWTGLVDSDWEKLGNWSCAKPNSTSDVTIPDTPHDPVIATKVLLNSLTIELGASLTLAPTAELEVTATLTNEGVAANLLLQSNASSTASLLHNTDNVPATIERYMPADLNDLPVYHTVSVPLTDDANAVSGLFMWSFLFSFDAGAQDWFPYGILTNTPLVVDQGYLIIKDIVEPGGTTEPDPTYVFAGPMNNGEFTCAVAYIDNPAVVGNTHQNLVPNPYPSAIDWDAANGWTKTNIYDAIWIWDPALGNYAAYGGDVSINDATQYIPVGQSFFVSAKSTSPVPGLIMDNDVRVHEDQAFYKNENEIVELLRIKSSANNFGDEAVVRFVEGASSVFDGEYDVTKFYGNADAPQLFSMSSDNKELSINSLEVGSEKRFVDLGFKLEASGLCSLNFSGMESFNADMQIQLKDRVTGQTIDLRANPEYSFAHSPENDPMRFELIFNGVTSIDEPKTVNQDFFYVDGSLYLNFPQDSQGPFNITVYNINGQSEFMGVAHEARAVVDLAGLTKGFHIVRVVTNDYSGEKKVVVK